MLIFRDSNKSFKINRDLLKTMTNYTFNVTHSNPRDQKLIHAFGKEMDFDNNRTGRKNKRDKSLAKLLKSPIIMVTASGVSTAQKKKPFSITTFFSSNPNELCNRIKLPLQHKPSGFISNLINEEIVAIADKLLDYKCISTKQHIFFTF